MSDVPIQIGSYTLLEKIGKGGMAEVYRAQWAGHDNMLMPCAVKLMLPNAVNPTSVQLFRNEQRLALLLSHQNICRLFPTGGTSDGSRLYIPMEWINGLDLLKLSKSMRSDGKYLSYDVIGYIVHCLLRALQHAHTLVVGGQPHPIIHRDISPHNVMLSCHGEVKLMDFGVALLLSSEETQQYFAGKLRYASREQVAGEVRAASDLFAVGALLHEMIEGCRFREDCLTTVELLERIPEEAPPILTRPEVPPNLRALHRGLLQRDMEFRIQTSTEALDVLGDVVAAQKALSQLVCAQIGTQANMSGSTRMVRAAILNGGFEESVTQVFLPRAKEVPQTTPLRILEDSQDIPQPRRRPIHPWVVSSPKVLSRALAPSTAEESGTWRVEVTDTGITESKDGFGESPKHRVSAMPLMGFLTGVVTIGFAIWAFWVTLS
jgi:serine/threonine protein kinase